MRTGRDACATPTPEGCPVAPIGSAGGATDLDGSPEVGGACLPPRAVGGARCGPGSTPTSDIEIGHGGATRGPESESLPPLGTLPLSSHRIAPGCGLVRGGGPCPRMVNSAGRPHRVPTRRGVASRSRRLAVNWAPSTLQFVKCSSS
eukprot:scaffold12417_cov131-Isochrysis_galbana.AAC.10